jgi:hypothetical protein
MFLRLARKDTKVSIRDITAEAALWLDEKESIKELIMAGTRGPCRISAATHPLQWMDQQNTSFIIQNKQTFKL